MMSSSASSPLRRLVVCADDYGISPAVSAGIRELVVKGRLSATGAMTSMPSWPAEAPALRELQGQVSVGLHLTLTDQTALGPIPGLAPTGRLPRLPDLFRAAFSGRIDPDLVAIELERQLDSFESCLGRSPDFIDGHQHVHLLPGIRRAVLGLFGRRLDPSRCWLRDCTDGWMRIAARGQAAKAGFVAALGLPLSLAAKRAAIPVNRGFSGFYDPARTPFIHSLGRMVAGAGDGHLLMIHPGHVDAGLVACDSLTTPREAEWALLATDDFPARLASLGFVVAEPGFPG